MTICVNKVVLHKHFKECCCTKSRDQSIKRMLICFKISDRNTLHEAFNQNRVSGFLIKSVRKFYIFVTLEVLVKDVEVIFFNIKINLINKRLF